MLLLASTLGVMAGATVTPVLEVIRTDLGVGGTAAGLIITTHGLAIAVTSPLVGRLIDRWGARAPLVAGLVLYGLGGGAGMFTTTYPALIASRVVLGIGAAAVFGGTTVALLTLYQGARRDRVLGWRTTATTMGGLLWPLLAGALGGISWHTSFAVSTVGLPLGLAAALSLPAATHAVQERHATGGGVRRLLRRHPMLLAWYAVMLTSGLMLYTVVVFLPQRLAQLGVRDPFQVSLFLAVMAVAASVVGLLYARLRARLGVAVLLRLAAGCRVASFAILGLATTPAVVFAAPALFGLANGLLMPTLTVLIGDTPPPQRRGQATTLSATAMFTGQFLAPLVFGPLMAATSITTGYLAAAGLAAAVLLALLAVKVPAAPAAPGQAEPQAPAATTPRTT